MTRIFCDRCNAEVVDDYRRYCLKLGGYDLCDDCSKLFLKFIKAQVISQDEQLRFLKKQDV